MPEKIGVVQWWQDNGKGFPCETPIYYRIDDPKAGKMLFTHLKNNAEDDGREKLTIEHISKEDWDEIEKHGATP